MLKRWFGFLTVLALVASAGMARAQDGEDVPRLLPMPAPEDRTDYFPTRVGMTWVYVGQPMEIARQVRLAGAERSLPPRTYFWDFQGQRRIRKADDGRIFEVREGKERLLLDLNAAEGASWTIEGGGEDILDGSVMTVISRTGRVEVPEGIFENVLHLGIKPNPHLSDAGVTEAWFAPGVGLVKWTETTIAGPQTYELAKFDPAYSDPIVIEPLPVEPRRPLEEYANRAAEVRDGVRYEIGTMQASYAQGDVIEMQYRVTAVDGEATFQFGSTQQIDFRLDNADGDIVWAWSANMLFGKALTSLALSPGESRSFEAQLNLDYELLPGGDYTLLGWMPSGFGGEGIASENTFVKVAVVISGDPVRGSLAGTVRDQEGHPVFGAVISLERFGYYRADGGYLPPDDAVFSEIGNATSPDGVVSPDIRDVSRGGIWAEPSVVAVTDEAGAFALRGLRVDTYALTVRADGYDLYAQQIEIAEGENRVDIRLRVREQGEYPNVNTTRSRRFVAELATDREHYTPGDVVRVRYRLTNVSGEALTLTFPSGQQYDLALDGSRGRVWTWSMDKLFPAVVSTRVFAPEETFEFQEDVVLDASWATGSPSFLLTAYLAVGSQAEGEVTSEETQAVVKFAMDGWVMPEPGRPGPLQASVQIDREQYKRGETVRVLYHLVNISDEPVALKFNSGQRYDLVLYGSEGPVWGWSWNKRFTADMGEIVLAARDTFAVDESIPLDEVPDIEDGVYVVHTYVTATGADGTPDQDATGAKVRFWLGETPVTRPPDEPVEPVVSGRLHAVLDADIQADSVRVTYRAVNVSRESLHLMFRSGQVYDLVLEGPEGEMWRWSDGRGFTDALHAQWLASGDSLVVREAFARPVMGDGDYALRGYLAVTPDEPGAVSGEETQAHLKWSVQSGTVLRNAAQPGESKTDSAARLTFGDFLRFAVVFGKTSQMADFEAAFDFDGNGRIDFADFLKFASMYGE